MTLKITEELFIDNFNVIQKDVHATAKIKGWWSLERNKYELLDLIHSEVSEVTEALRLGNPSDDKIPEFSGAEAELADVVIRIMDMAEAFNYKVAEAIIEKTKMNKTREYRHGGKEA